MPVGLLGGFGEGRSLPQAGKAPKILGPSMKTALGEGRLGKESGRGFAVP